jgi:CRISPR-associated endonuclease Csn1
MNKSKSYFGFDMGTGSIGECVRISNQVKHLDSILIPNELASIKKQAEIRRQYRTRLSHKARENWWKQEAKKAGIETLESSQPTEKNPEAKPDKRLLREFPKDGDNTIYTSCLLRIALLQGMKLEGWQIYKAVWSALQHRGYDDNLPWKRSAKRNIEDESTDKADDEKENREATQNYYKLLKQYFGDKKEFYFPCYFEAIRMGIWSPNDPKNLSKKNSSNPSPARNRQDSNVETAIAPRKLVEQELRELLIQASKEYPKLKNSIDYILYGEGRQAYSSFSESKFKKFRGTNWDWQGILGQKIPRFDNRIISKCALIPRLNVCKADDEINQDVTFLMKLKNMRYFDSKYKEKALTIEQINNLFEKFGQKRSITEKQWKKWLSDNLEGYPHIEQMKVEKPKVGGRSRFCRPALRILKEEILLGGKKPHDLYDELVAVNKNTDTQKGLINEDYKFLLEMPPEWENFSIPDNRNADTKLSKSERMKLINEIINEVNHPIVRHRLHFYVRRLQSLSDKFGEPDNVVLEIIRDPQENFSGEKSKRQKKYIKAIKDNTKEKDEAYKDVQRLGLKGKNALLKMMLFREQVGKDFYSLQSLNETKIDEYHIDHIVPASRGNCDAYINKILTTYDLNEKKGNKTPYEWLHNESNWTAILDAVEKSNLHKKKKALLTSENAEDLLEKYQTLAATAYVTKLAQRVTALFFGWPHMSKGSQKRVKVIPGSYTAKLRRRYNLDYILHPDISEKEYKELLKEGKIETKNRTNPRHHALDALVASVAPEVKYDSATQKFSAPSWLTPDFCKHQLEGVYPQYVAFTKPKLAETMYGMRKIKDKGKEYYVAITRFGAGTALKEFEDLKNAKKYTSGIFNEEIRNAFQKKLDEEPTQEQWSEFLKKYRTGNGSRPNKIAQISSGLMSGKDIDATKKMIGEYKNMGKHNGQYYKDKKEHKGRIVYKSDGKWICEPVYVYESVYEKTKEAIKKAQSKVHFFRALELVEIKKECSVGKSIIVPGTYVLNTIFGSPQSAVGKIIKVDRSQSYLPLMKNLMEIGQMESAQRDINR